MRYNLILHVAGQPPQTLAENDNYSDIRETFYDKVGELMRTGEKYDLMELRNMPIGYALLLFRDDLVYDSMDYQPPRP